MVALTFAFSQIKGFLEQSGYKLNLFASLNDANVEIKQLTYETQIKIQPPIISNTHFMDDEFKKVVRIRNKFNLLNQDKITIGMCGSLMERKNSNMFLKLAQLMPNFNFVWIGGAVLIGEDIKNFYHIQEIQFPYKYYRQLDYFILTSTIDPCPYVVLENLYLDNRILTFTENIF